MAIRPETKRFYVSFAKAVFDARRALGMDLRELAEKAEMDPAVLSKIENGKAGPGGVPSVPMHLGLRLVAALGLEETGGVWRASPELLRAARKRELERQQAEIAAQLAALNAPEEVSDEHPQYAQ